MTWVSRVPQAGRREWPLFLCTVLGSLLWHLLCHPLPLAERACAPELRRALLDPERTQGSRQVAALTHWGGDMIQCFEKLVGGEDPAGTRKHPC